ncbi:hypothetical protein PEP31012_02277 [Pandoraea eparura]|uniref:Uncharacterized protein n=1 Tax=Pandoraea eparura TaxID=2508291 RepID=A0A5E4UXW7_9BURK|nr:hypothetical protein [Pandoraea eparura]VVE04154.1 hypothetical protein PEP31012_02277 [Pandoraea eparura]
MGTIFAASRSLPVHLISINRSKPPDDGNSFGSDFQRLGSVATSALGSTGKPWQSYPVRPRSTQANNGIALGSWCAERDREVLHAKRLRADPLMPKFVGEGLERWRARFVDAVDADVTFERARASAMQRVRHGIPAEPTAFVRTFATGAVRAQLGEIARLSDEVRKLTATIPALPDGSARKIALRNRDDLATLRDAMAQLTLNSHGRKDDLLRSELNALVALNDMAREAQREMTNGGADVPLRLAVRDGNWVLKPAASTSWFARNKTRAANDAARLALLLGYPADRPVTLKMICARGFGAHEYTTVLNDARSRDREAARSWLAARALDIDTWKAATGAVRDGLAPSATGRAPASEHDDSRLGDDLAAGADPRSPNRERSHRTVTRQVGSIRLADVIRPASADPTASPSPDDSDDSEAPDTDARGYARLVRADTPSDVPHYVAPDGSEYARVTRAELSPTSASATSQPSRREQFAEAFCKAHPGQQHSLREIFSRSMLSTPSSSEPTAHASGGLSGRRAGAMPLSPPPAPPLSELPTIRE